MSTGYNNLFIMVYRTIVNKMVETSSEIDNVIHLLIKTKVSGYIMLCN